VSRVLDLFIELCAIPSPPGEERAVADRITRELDAMGLEWDEDGSGPTIGSTAGNVLCRLPGSTDGGVPIFLCAHFDTVPLDGELEPVVGERVVHGQPEVGPELLDEWEGVLVEGRGRGQDDVRLGDGAGRGMDEVDLHLVGAQGGEQAGEDLDAPLDVGLEDEGELLGLAFLGPLEELVQSDPLGLDRFVLADLG